MSNNQENALTWHPIVLVLSRYAPKHEQVVHFAHSLTRQSGLLTFATVVPDAWSNPDKLDTTRKSLEAYFRKENIECLIEVQTSENEFEAFFHMVKSYGIGQIQPNTVMLALEQEGVLSSYLVETLYQCYLSRKNILLLDEKVHESFRPSLEKQDRTIDIWWNATSRASFDLAVSYVTILLSTPDWGQTTVYLKALAPTQQAKESLEKYLQELVKNIRIEVQVAVFEQETFDEDLPFHIKTRQTSLVLIPIQPIDEKTPIGQYESYLNSLIQINSHVPCIFVSCYDNTEHKEIYLDPLQQD